MSFIWGRFSIEAFVHDWIEWAAGLSIIVGGVLVFALVTYYRLWGFLWREWLTSVDHKKIGIMYLVVSTIMLFKGFVDALMMRAQQVFAVGDSFGYLGASHFQQIFTAHGVTMIFFVAMGVVLGLVNLIMPLQIGARDVAFPFLNNLSFWLFAFASTFILISLVVGNFSGAGWLGYPPLTGKEYSPGVGIDYWIWTLQISGAGSLLSGINFLVTIFKMRCPGMCLMKMPLFTWSVLVTMVLVVFAFPIITATLGLLSLDRVLDTHFFTSNLGGNPMMFVNLIWAWGHPEVYILILPAFGIYSEVVATFSRKKLFGYTSMVWALIAISVLSFIVWLHHFFTMGAGANVNAFFGIMTMLIAIPTGVKIFNWLFTMYRGRVEFTTPMLWFLSFTILFSIGGMGGVLMAVPPADFQIHNSLFLIAHFHTMIIPGVLFGVFAGITYWWPKIAGYRLDEMWGKWAWGFWTVGFFLAFMPLYALGFMGATRRMNQYPDVPGWRPLFILAAFGACLIACGVACQAIQFYVSYKKRASLKDSTGDPWDGRTLEWKTKSPPMFYNFPSTPEVSSIDPLWEEKQEGKKEKKEAYGPIHMPKNTPYGVFVGLFSFLCSFGIIWWMWWLALGGLLGILGSLLCHLNTKQVEYELSAQQVEEYERSR